MSKASTRISALTSATTLALALAATTGVVQAQTTLKKVQDTGEIVMGVRESSSPLSFTTGNNQFTGYHVELCLAIIDKMKATVGKPINVK